MSPRSPPSSVKVEDQAVQVADRDEPLQGDRDGRLPLQVLGDVGVLDLVGRRHLQSHLLVQDGSSARSMLPKDPFPRVVGVSL